MLVSAAQSLCSSSCRLRTLQISTTQRLNVVCTAIDCSTVFTGVKSASQDPWPPEPQLGLIAHLHIPQWGPNDCISAHQAEQVQQNLAVQLEARCVEGVCHDCKHLTHELCIVGLVELGSKLTGGEGLEHIL
eukprot:GHRR01025529.1.p1 GENE.GHRR01025529.1~~GHRR01025529.1.p1  ORF type:complete len:132 (+),score=25.42 GHRR01025529.1:352-747(+)